MLRTAPLQQPIQAPPRKQEKGRTAETVRPITGIYTRFTFCPYDAPPKANSIFKTFGGTVRNNPLGFTFFLSALLISITPHKQVIISGSLEEPKTREFLKVLNERFEPFLRTLLINKEQIGLLEKNMEINKGFLNSHEPTIYFCENFACNKPTSDVEEFLKLLQK